MSYTGTNDDYECLWDYRPQDLDNKTTNQLKEELKQQIIKNDVSVDGVRNYIKNLMEFLGDNRTFPISAWESTVVGLGDELEWYNKNTFKEKFVAFMNS